MAAPALERATTDAVQPSGLSVGLLFLAGGVLMAAGGQLHPIGSGPTVEAHLASMFDSPRWNLSHLVLLVGMLVSVLAFVTAWRTQTFGPRVQRLLPAVIACWAFGAAELVPHLLAASEADALAHHAATPVLDLHVVLQMFASPAVGLSGALIAVAVAVSGRTWSAWVLAAVGVLGGVGSALAGPVVALTGDPHFAVLFAFQAGLAIWLVGTGVRLLLRRRSVVRGRPRSTAEVVGRQHGQ